jgi:hypothetical protein
MAEAEEGDEDDRELCQAMKALLDEVRALGWDHTVVVVVVMVMVMMMKVYGACVGAGC